MPPSSVSLVLGFMVRVRSVYFDWSVVIVWFVCVAIWWMNASHGCPAVWCRWPAVWCTRLPVCNTRPPVWRTQPPSASHGRRVQYTAAVCMVHRTAIHMAGLVYSISHCGMWNRCVESNAVDIAITLSIEYTILQVCSAFHLLPLPRLKHYSYVAHCCTPVP